MVVRAVIFDYFGTLARTNTMPEHVASRRRIAHTLGVDPEAFRAEMDATYAQRVTGVAGHDPVRVLRWLARRLGVEPDDTQLVAAARQRLVEFAHVPTRAEAVPVLRALRHRGLQIGLITDCSCELPAVWPSLPVAPYVDTAVFSIREGVRKPATSLYLTACRRLGVTAGECVYVGDGGSSELFGARAAGMYAVRLLLPDHQTERIHEPDTRWDGTVVNRLGQVVDLVDTLRGAQTPADAGPLGAKPRANARNRLASRVLSGAYDDVVGQQLQGLAGRGVRQVVQG